MTARDLAKLADYIIHDFPEFYPIYGEPEFTWNKITQRNRNPLLEMNIGADGLKTGFTEESGYGLVGSAVRDGQRLIVVINGTEERQGARRGGAQAARLGLPRLRAGQPLRQGRGRRRGAASSAATQGRVGLVSKGPRRRCSCRAARASQVKARVVYTGPMPAPVEAGQEIGIVPGHAPATT